MKVILICISLAVVAVVAIFTSSLESGSPKREQPATPVGGRVFPVNEAGEEVDLAYLSQISVEDLAHLVPEQSGIRFTDCPACKGGVQDTGKFSWDPRHPRQIRCLSCNETYPGNPKFPDLANQQVASLGKVHLYPSYRREDGYHFYFQAHRDHLSRKYLATAARDFARTWWKTRDDDAARRAAALLVRFAEVYPGYAMHYDYPFTPKVIVPPDHGIIAETKTRPKLTAKWDYWTYLEISQELSEAYDILRHWQPLQEMAGGRAIEKIERDLLTGMLTLALGTQEKYRAAEPYTNMSSVLWRDALRVARLTRNPEALLDILARARIFFEQYFLYDGSWYETSPSYGQQVYNSMIGIKAALSGSIESFAPGQLDDRQITEITTLESLLNVAMKRQHASLAETRFPDGGLLPINDTWASRKGAARKEMEAVLFPGMGVAILGGGKGNEQFHGYLNFSGGTGHIQRSALSIGLWAQGSELLSDIGYTHTSYRFWATSTASHSTVLVDGQEQALDPAYSGNRLMLWADNGRDFHIAEAESATAYPELERYQRTLVAIGHNSKDSYLVDLFQVSGGSQHDYLLAGNADEPSSAQLNLPVQPLGASIANRQLPFNPPLGESDRQTPESGLTYLRNLRASHPAPAARLDFRTLREPHTGIRSWVDCGGPARFFLADAPSVRPALEKEGAINQSVMPMLIARRTGENLASRFVAVHAPLGGAGERIGAVDVRRIGEAILVTVHQGTRKDMIFLATGKRARLEVQTPEGEVRFEGKAGWLRWKEGKAVEGELVNGSELAGGGLRITGGHPFEGTIVEVGEATMDAEYGGWFLVAERPPAAGGVDALIVCMADGTTRGYNIVRIEPTGSGSRIYVKERPALSLSPTATQLLSFPQRTILGSAPRYEAVTRSSSDAAKRVGHELP